ncbi:MAG: UDP-4-amino-4,6-dideoxy-N-acetyl-beta-L-altrosamine N-acetyltransferase, partial [Candidatus Omnitrophica bacterium]|nr:UDP-4-amino-4,6-dideoxy-N-acetyl-beta-L-altrosamine N-acetyltransferase [Candidatus Omnitrophota bacterium]
MKISVLTEGGRHIGFGHVTRCIALSKAFEEKKAIINFIINSDNSVRIFFKNRAFKKLDWARHYKTTLRLVKGTDFIIIDSYLAARDFYNKIYRDANNSTLIIIDDYNRIPYPGGIVINPSVYGDRIRYPDNKDIAYLLGEKYIILRKEFWHAKPAIIHKHVKNILVTFGGMRVSDINKKVVSYLKDKFKHNIYTACRSKNPISSKDMLKLMVKSDICVSAGGQTTYELARLSVPTIGICFSDNQERNLKAWDEIGFVKYIGWRSDPRLLEKLGKAIMILEDSKTRKDASQNARHKVDGMGVFRIRDRALAMRLQFANILKTKPKTQDRARLWRNKLSIRKHMLSTHIISKEEHKKWLAMLGRKKNAKAWVIFLGQNALGLVSLRDIDMNRFSADWGFYIGEDAYRGIGLGSRILSRLLFMAFEETKLKFLKTDVLAENFRALNLYRKFGFKKSGKKIFSTSDLRNLFGVENSNTLNKQIRGLISANVITRISKGYYYLASNKPSDFELANVLYRPSY